MSSYTPRHEGRENRQIPEEDILKAGEPEITTVEEETPFKEVFTQCLINFIDEFMRF